MTEKASFKITLPGRTITGYLKRIDSLYPPKCFQIFETKGESHFYIGELSMYQDGWGTMNGKLDKHLNIFAGVVEDWAWENLQHSK